MPIQGHLGVAWGGIHGMFSCGYGMALWVKLVRCGLDIARCTIKQTQTSQPHFLRFNRGELGTRGAPHYLINRLAPGEVAMFGRDSIRRQGYAWRVVGERWKCVVLLGMDGCCWTCELVISLSMCMCV